MPGVRGQGEAGYGGEGERAERRWMVTGEWPTPCERDEKAQRRRLMNVTIRAHLMVSEVVVNHLIVV